MKSYLLKLKAREQLKGKWGLAIATNVLASLLLNLLFMWDVNMDNEKFGILLVFLSIGSLFIASPIQAGKAEFLLNMAKEKEAKISDLFSQFNIFIKVFAMMLFIYLIQFLIIIIPMVLLIIMMTLSIFNFTFANLSTSIIIISLFLIIAMVILVMIVNLKYSQVLNIMVENPEMKIGACMKESSRLMKGYKWKYLCLQLSFWTWWVLSLITFGLASFWAGPYSSLANTNFYLELKKREEKQIVL